jgi:hypothetical protein
MSTAGRMRFKDRLKKQNAYSVVKNSITKDFLKIMLKIVDNFLVVLLSD